MNYRAWKTKYYTPLIVFFLLSIFFIQATTSVLKRSNTWDESGHLLSGYAYVKNGIDYLEPSHPVLGRLIPAIPLLFFELRFEPDKVKAQGAANSNFYPYSLEFLFENNVDGKKLLFYSRLAMIVLGIILGIHVFAWARMLYGNKGGLLALFFYVLCPNILAHSSLVTTDFPLTAFFFIALFYLYLLTERITILRVFLAGITLGLALTTKYSALLLLLPYTSAFLYLFLKKGINLGNTINSLMNYPASSYSVSYISPPLTPLSGVMGGDEGEGEKISTTTPETSSGQALTLFRQWGGNQQKPSNNLPQTEHGIIKINPKKRAMLLSAIVTLLLLTSYLTIWGVYGFHYRGSFLDETSASYKLTKGNENNPPIPPLEKGGKGGFEVFSGKEPVDYVEKTIYRWDENRTNNVALNTVFDGIRYLRLLPESYIFGLQRFLTRADEGHASFLMGDYSGQGWWYYFLIAFLIKTPIPMLYLFFGALLFFSRYPNRIISFIFLISPIVLMFIASFMQHINIGLRHILPVYPFLYVLISGLVCVSMKRIKLAKGIFSLLLLWTVWTSIKIYPYYLAYFNEFIGGPKNSYKYLVDSNLDWGQDLPGLKEYMDEHKIEKIKLSYFGLSDPAYYGINYEYLPSYAIPKPNIERPQIPLEGYFAISATMLQGVYLPDRDFYKLFREIEPVDTIGYSIFIYKFDEAKE